MVCLHVVSVCTGSMPYHVGAIEVCKHQSYVGNYGMYTLCTLGQDLIA